MSRAQWTSSAKADLRDTYLWIARHDNRRDTARNVIRGLRQQCDQYAIAFANGSVLGTSRNDLGELVRVFTYKRWVIVFRAISNGIEVLRVVDGSRDFTRIFAS
jgi:plasmid stabilization system protein ParE